MKLLENTRVAQLPMQLIESSNISEVASFKSAQPKLTMIWVQESHEGRQSMVAKWLVGK
ncbi:MAG: hypothetical protein RMY28_031625 [Nostoc sp. ChiSLP01]|nr:hypothetical protein [Nostoc sp. CmiSLP01]MDZ8287941.1 hypothetical protein [Nostoc sp. ChiSLP01]